MQSGTPRDADFKQTLCANFDGFSLHAAVFRGADDPQALELKRVGWLVMGPF